jgi:hypothetical protein
MAERKLFWIAAKSAGSEGVISSVVAVHAMDAWLFV